MYSPADLPSSNRAAPAKKRSWSALISTSSFLTIARNCPVLRIWASTISSACAQRRRRA